MIKIKVDLLNKIDYILHNYYITTVDMKSLIWIFILCVILTSCWKPSPIVKDSNTQIIDVRTVEEFNEWHISWSINISLPNIEDKSWLSAINKDKEISVYCRTWRRSSIAKRKLEEFWYKNIKDLWSIEKASQSLKIDIIK